MPELRHPRTIKSALYLGASSRVGQLCNFTLGEVKIQGLTLERLPSERPEGDTGAGSPANMTAITSLIVSLLKYSVLNLIV